MKFVTWDHEIPNIWKVKKIHGSSHHQPVLCQPTPQKNQAPSRRSQPWFPPATAQPWPSHSAGHQSSAWWHWPVWGAPQARAGMIDGKKAPKTMGKPEENHRNIQEKHGFHVIYSWFRALGSYNWLISCYLKPLNVTGVMKSLRHCFSGHECSNIIRKLLFLGEILRTILGWLLHG